MRYSGSSMISSANVGTNLNLFEGVNVDAERASVSGREMTTLLYYLDAERLDTCQM